MPSIRNQMSAFQDQLLSIYENNRIFAMLGSWLARCWWPLCREVARQSKRVVVIVLACSIALAPSSGAADPKSWQLTAYLLIAVLAAAAGLFFMRGAASETLPQRVSNMIRLAVLGCCFVAGATPAYAQDPLDPTFETGTKQFASYVGGQIDQTSLLQGGLTVDIPLIAYPQRGKLKLRYVLHYYNQGLFADNNCGGFGGCYSVPSGYLHGMTVIEVGAATGGSVSCPQLVGAKPSYACNAYVSEPDGSFHLMQPIGQTTWQAVDASGYRLDVAPGALPGSSWTYTTWPDGTRFSSSGGGSLNAVVEDTNGNKILITGDTNPATWTDTMGRVIPAWSSAYMAAFNAYSQGTAGDTTGCTGPLPIAFAFTWNPPGLNGGTYPIKFCVVAVTETFPPLPNPTLTPTSYTTYNIQSVIPPDGKAWTFQYTTEGHNDLSQVGFPTGGVLSYTWTSPPALSNSHPFIFTRGIATRTLDPNDGVNPAGTSHYQYAVNGNTTVVTDAARNDTTHTFTPLGNNSLSMYETLTKVYQGSSNGGTLLRTVQTDYSFGSPILCTSFPPESSVVPIRVTTTLASGLQSKIERDYGASFTFSTCSDFDTSGHMNAGGSQTGSYGRVTATREYDFGAGAPGALLRTTSTPRFAFTNSSYLNNNLLDLLASKSMTDGNSASLENYGYDASTPVTSGISTQLDTAPFSGTARGNQTSVSKWLNTSITPVVTAYTWYDTGQQFQQIDPLGNAITLNYDAAYAGAYRTKTCNALNQCESATYDFNTGLMTSFTNVNASSQASGNTPGDSAHTTIYAYDSALRLTKATAAPDPTNGNASAVTNLTYSSPGTLPVSVQRQSSIAPGITDQLTTYFDGLGRVDQTRHAAPGCTEAVDKVYDAVGRVASVSNPYCLGTTHSSDPTYGLTLTQYDALDRVTTTTKQDSSFVTTQYDLTSAISANGDCATTTDEAGNPRLACYDGLGRLVEVDEPTGGRPAVAATGSVNIAGSEQSTQVVKVPPTPGTGSVQLSGSIQWANVASASTAGTTNITVSGSEQQNPNGITPGTGTITFGGSEQIIPATKATGNTSISGSEQSITAAFATGNVTISGSETCQYVTQGFISYYQCGGGIVSITVNGVKDSYQYCTPNGGYIYEYSPPYTVPNCDTPSTIASGLAAAINGDASQPVTASASGGTVYLTAKTAGPNYSLSVSVIEQVVSPPPFSASASGASLTGGRFNASDSGTVTVSINGTGYSRTFGSSDTASTIASALASTISADTLANASVSGGAISLTAKNSGAGGNYSVSCSATYDSSHFSSPSFSISCPSVLTGGKNEIDDAGKFSVTVNNQVYSVTWSKADGTSTLASNLASAVNNVTGGPVTATASGATVTLTATTKGTISNYPLSIAAPSYDSTDFTKASFSATASGATLTGGAPNNNAIDSGTVTVTVNGRNYSANFGSGSNAGSIASALVTALGADPTVTATLSGLTVAVTPKTSGTVYSFSTSSTYDSADFSHPSFSTTNSVSDYGTTTVTVNDHSDSVFWSYGATPASIASALASKINGDSSAAVTATASSNTVSLTARTGGTSSNYSLTSATANDTAHFSANSFSTSNSGATLAGGTNAIYGPAYDSGTVTLTVNGADYSAIYGQYDTASTVANSLASQVNAGGAVVASVSGTTLSLLAAHGGAATDYSLATSSATGQSSLFSSPSFSDTSSGAALTGGADGVSSSLASPLVTLYKYDALNNLLNVTQQGGATDPTQWRARTFTYDSLSRLVTSTNPESGTISYGYDADGMLLEKTSPAPNAQQGSTATLTVSYCYDQLNRVVAKGYALSPNPPQQCTGNPPALPNPAVTWVYDQGGAGANAVGKLISLTDQAGSAAYTYDVLGRTATEQRVIAGISKSMSYTYNLNGSIKTVTNPSGAVITYTPDSAGRDVSAIDKGNAINYAVGATYGPQGNLTGFISGSSGPFSGVTNGFGFNSRLQAVSISAVSPSATLSNIIYDYHLGAGDNGNVFAIINNKDTSRNQTFTYDALNRLTSAQNAGTDCSQTTANGKNKFWGNSYVYDPWGNLLQKNVTKCSSEGLTVTASVNNQLQGYTYDAAGNMTHDATSGLSYSYDQENRITGANGFTYTYDADGNRVEKSNGTTGTLYWYMSPGIVAESDLSGTLKSEYVFFDGSRVARRDGANGSGGVFYYFSDHLKTASIVTDSNGNILNESDYYPWGGEVQFANNDSNHYKFTGQERDSETQLDYFGARYYGNLVGRFLTPDPGNAGARNLDPQSWNAYTYVRNNPASLSDPNGKVFCRPATPGEQQEGISMVCDLTDRDYVNASPDQQKAYDQAGYKHYDCSCDTGADKDAWQHPNGNAGTDYVGYVVIFVAVLLAKHFILPEDDQEDHDNDQRPARNPNDEDRENNYPNPPDPNNGNGTIGPNQNQNAELQKDIQQMKQQGYTDIRVNQEQVNSEGVRVGRNRPDLQGTDPNGVRHYVEYDTDPQSSAQHVQRIRSNDPNGVITPKVIK